MGHEEFGRVLRCLLKKVTLLVSHPCISMAMLYTVLDLGTYTTYRVRVVDVFHA